MNHGNARNMWKYIPTARKIQMVHFISKMPDGLDKDVLTLCFVADMSPPTAAKYAATTNSCIGRKGSPVSARRIQQICKTYFPDCYDYAPKSPQRTNKQKQRKTYLIDKDAIIAAHPFCEMCSDTKQLEIHHDVPLSRGGDNSPDNLHILCHKCHIRLEANRARIYGAAYYNYWGKHSKTSDNGQLSFDDVNI